MRSRASRITTSQPCRLSTAAARSPEIPAPTTITFFGSDLAVRGASSGADSIRVAALRRAARSEPQLLGFKGLLPGMEELR